MTQEQVFPSPETTTSLCEKPKNHRIFIIAQLILRVLVPLFTLAAIIRTITSDQITKVPDGGSFGARYSYSSALRYMVIADIVVGVSCFLSLILMFVCFIYPKWNIKIKNYVYIFLHDLVLLLLITSATSAASSIGMLALHGEAKIGWVAICISYPKFCHRIILGVVFSYMALSCLFILTILGLLTIHLPSLFE